MDKYKNMISKVLSSTTQPKKIILEGVYSKDISERMHPKLEQDLMDSKHSLGKHPAIPDGHDVPFENKILGNRFDEIVKRYKRVFDVDTIDNRQVMTSIVSMLSEVMEMESTHKKELVDLAIKMVREEFDMSEDAVEINAELTEEISLEDTQKKKSKADINEIEWDSHEHIKEMNDAVYKRRMLNALTQGAAVKCNHSFIWSMMNYRI